MREPSVLGDPGERRDNLSGWLMYLVIFVGLMARMLVATYGHNYDMDSYRIVAGIIREAISDMREKELPLSPGI